MIVIYVAYFINLFIKIKIESHVLCQRLHVELIIVFKRDMNEILIMKF